MVQLRKTTVPLRTNTAWKLFSGGASVGSHSGSSSHADLFQSYIQSSVSFDSISISMLNGFALDNLTLEDAPVAVSEPSVFALLSLGLLGFGFSRRKMK